MITMLNCDCMEYMAGCADKAFDLAIVDPPYGVTRKGAQWSIMKDNINAYKLFDDTAPAKEYFDELFRVSKNQIIWGGNYFILPISRGWIYWNKQTPTESYADCELAWTSFDKNLKCFDYMWTNVKMGHGDGFKSNKPANIHPTQKPVALYKWLLSRYAKPGDKILDTHGGSGSICIACHDLGFDLTWMELDADYFAAASKRYQEHAAQATLFAPDEVRQPEQGILL